MNKIILPIILLKKYNRMMNKIILPSILLKKYVTSAIYFRNCRMQIRGESKNLEMKQLKSDFNWDSQVTFKYAGPPSEKIHGENDEKGYSTRITEYTYYIWAISKKKSTTILWLDFINNLDKFEQLYYLAKRIEYLKKKHNQCIAFWWFNTSASNYLLK